MEPAEWPDNDPLLTRLDRPTRRLVADAFRHGFWVLPLALYWLTCCRGVGWVDAGMIVNEVFLFKTGSWVNVHNLFIVLGRLWLLFFPIGTPAYSLNLFAGLLGALTVHFGFRVALLLTDHLLAAVVGGVALMLGHSLWWHSTMVEVYTLNTTLLALTVFLVVRWNRYGDLVDLYKAVFCWGLGVSNHVLMGLYLFAFLALFAIPAERRTLWKPGVFSSGVAAFLLGAQIWAVEFERDYTSLLDRHPLAEQTVSTRLDVLGDALYSATGGKFHEDMFDTDNPRSPLLWHENYAFLWGYQYPSVAWPLGLVGLVAWARDRRLRTSFVFFAVGLGVQALWSSNYFVWDMYAFGLPVWVMWGLLVGSGFDAVYRLGGRARTALLASLPTLALGPCLYASISSWTMPAFFQSNVFRGAALYDSTEYVMNPNKRSYTRTEDVIAGLAATLPQDAHLFDSDAKGYYPFRMYAQRVLGVRPDVTEHLIFGAFLDPEKVAGLAREMATALDSGRPVFVVSVARPERPVLARLERMLDPDAPDDRALERLGAPAFIDQFPVWDLQRVPLEGVDQAVIYQFVRRSTGG